MKIGDYVRTKKGYIRKIIIEPNFYQDTIFVDTHTHFKKTDIVKSSPNIIDLIEVGDYVNGIEITQVIPPDICGDEELTDTEIYCGSLQIYEEDIKSIVTKEQFESMEYKL